MLFHDSCNWEIAMHKRSSELCAEDRPYILNCFSPMAHIFCIWNFCNIGWPQAATEKVVSFYEKRKRIERSVEKECCASISHVYAAFRISVTVWYLFRMSLAIPLFGLESSKSSSTYTTEVFRRCVWSSQISSIVPGAVKRGGWDSIASAFREVRELSLEG